MYKDIKNLKPLYIVGPTASGKSELAYKTAKLFDSVIISADSMQIYKELNIGTAKEPQSRRNEIPHKMIDIVSYKSEYSVAEFAKEANEHINNALKNNKLPIIVGGTGLYIEALLFPMSFSGVSKDDVLRNKLIEELNLSGAEALHEKLRHLDPESAEKLHVNDTKRVIRALEIVLTTGKTRKENKDEFNTPPNVLAVGLNTERQKLYDKINSRVVSMIEKGLIEEIDTLDGLTYQSTQAIGYREFLGYNIAGQTDGIDITHIQIDKIKEQIKQNTRNYAKRQITWFKKYNFINWFDCNNTDAAINFIVSELHDGT